jgi:ABC-type polysaccharide/polyol phosphate transport system ATPase subunit
MALRASTSAFIEDSLVQLNTQVSSPILPDHVSVKAVDLGLRFFRNPNRAFTFQGLYRNLFEAKHQQDDNTYYRWIWRGIDLEIHDGDVVAIMGPNGEGKTTLLRVLAGLLAPDEGQVVVRNQPFLLSAGLGLRDELNGYGNIRLGGLFLGVPLKEIVERTREIADFAELSEEAMEKPMRYYSDGMRARLVFSIATCSDRKILFLDEILGAGDVGFQHKAKRRMDEVMQKAQSILLVSHSTQFVRETANKALLLLNGKVEAFGDTDHIVREYERVCDNRASR